MSTQPIQANPMLQKRLEEALLNAWPALQQILLDGWVLRFSKGYTRRANSVNPLFESTMDVGKKIATCEKLYADKKLPTIFRMTPYSSPADLDQILEQSRYRSSGASVLFHFDIAHQFIAAAPAVTLREETLEDWMRFFCHFSRSSLGKHQTHKEMLQSIPGERLLFSITALSNVVACGLGVLEDEFFGIFDLVADPLQQQKGYGTKILLSMLKWAKKHGARHGYLHASKNSQHMRQLYTNLGFQELYEFWYRFPISVDRASAGC